MLLSTLPRCLTARHGARRASPRRRQESLSVGARGMRNTTREYQQQADRHETCHSGRLSCGRAASLFRLRQRKVHRDGRCREMCSVCSRSRHTSGRGQRRRPSEVSSRSSVAFICTARAGSRKKPNQVKVTASDCYITAQLMASRPRSARVSCSRAALDCSFRICRSRINTKSMSGLKGSSVAV